MEDVTIDHAKEHLEDLVARAARGEDVTIVDPKRDKVKIKLTVLEVAVEESLPTPLRKPRRLGLLEGRMQAPARLLEPMTAEELADWNGAEP